MSQAEAFIVLEKIARETLDKWLEVVSDKHNYEDIKDDVSSSIFAMLSSHASQVAKILIDKDIRDNIPKYAEKAVQHWLAKGGLELKPQPISEWASRGIYQAASVNLSKKRMEVYKRINGGMKKEAVAEQMALTVNTVERIYRSVKKEHRDLRTKIKRFE